MKNEIDIKNIQSKIDSIGLEFKILEYKKCGKKSKFEHKCGHIFDMKIYHLLDRKKCPKCDGKWRDIEMFQNKSNEVHDFEYEILEFKNGNEYVRIKHKNCGNLFNQVGYRHLRGDRCTYCYGNKKLLIEEIIERSNNFWNFEYEILSDKIEYSKKSLIKHKKCGYEYEQLISSHLIGHGCPKCAGNAPLTKEIVQEKSDKIHNCEYEILSEPKGAFSKIEIRHKLCERIFSQIVSDHFSGCGCSICNQSKKEKFIESVLISNNMLHEKQKTFEDCKFKNKLKFDFYLPEYNTCIEFDGIQHFKPIRYFGGKKAFNLQIIKDNIKNEYCVNKKIKLIRFNYEQDTEYIKNILLNL
jgi:hypothetical protein